MKYFIKENWLKLVIIAIMALFLFSFYWIEIRPVLARRSCSWVVKAMPADFGVTKEKAEENRKAFEQCKKITPISIECWLLEIDSKERSFKPGGKELVTASKSEYESCLRHKGL